MSAAHLEHFREALEAQLKQALYDKDLLPLRDDRCITNGKMEELQYHINSLQAQLAEFKEGL